MAGYEKVPKKYLDYIPDFYAILEITDGPFPEFLIRLKEKYRELSKQFHPDRFEHAHPNTKNEILNKYQLIQEGNEILRDETKKKNYDQRLEEFKKNRPNLVSISGRPILDLMSESFDLDFLFQGGAFDFDEDRKREGALISAYNETVFNIVETQYKGKPNDAALKKAYLDQLSSKKAHLYLQEMFSWQKMGVVNFQEPKKNLDSNYIDQIKSKIESLENNSSQSIETRLLSAHEYPLLIDGRNEIATIDSTQSLSVIKEKMFKLINEHKDEVLSLAKEKESLNQKILNTPIFERIHTSDSDVVRVILHDNSKAFMAFQCQPDSGGNARIEKNDFKEMPVFEAKKLAHKDTTYLLLLNSDVHPAMQMKQFFQLYFEDKLEESNL